MMLLKQVSALVVACALVLATAQGELSAAQTDQSATQAPQQTPEQLRQLVAPIALYPDALVAQILAASSETVPICSLRVNPTPERLRSRTQP